MVFLRLNLHQIVAIDEGRVVDVVDDHVQISVQIQVGVGRAVGKRRHANAPLFGHVLERQVAPIAEGKIFDFHGRNLADQIILGSHGATFGAELGKIAVGDVAGKAVGHDQVAVAVVVEVGQQRRPAPIGFGHISHHAHIGKNRLVGAGLVAHVDLHGVADVLVGKAIQVIVQVALITVGSHQSLLALVVARQHIEGHHVGQTVVIEVGHVVAHRRVAGVLEVCLRLVGESPVTVVDVQQVVGQVVVGDVNILVAVAVEVGDVDAQAVAFGLDARCF